MIVVDFSPSSMTKLALGGSLCFQQKEWFPLLGLQSSQRAVGYHCYTCCYCPLMVIMISWSLLWLMSIIAEQECWLLPSFRSLHGTFDINKTSVNSSFEVVFWLQEKLSNRRKPIGELFIRKIKIIVVYFHFHFRTLQHPLNI